MLFPVTPKEKQNLLHLLNSELFSRFTKNKLITMDILKMQKDLKQRIINGGDIYKNDITNLRSKINSIGSAEGIFISRFLLGEETTEF